MSAARQLQLAKRENFFSDPLFKDIWSFEDGDLQKRLETFKNKSALAIPGKADTAHNLQVRIKIFTENWAGKQNFFVMILTTAYFFQV